MGKHTVAIAKHYHSEEQEHKCYMHSIPASKNNNEMIHRFIFYDFESMLLPSGNHEPNLVVANSICGKLLFGHW